MSKHLFSFIVEARVFSIEPKTGEIKVQSMGVGVQAFNKGNARKRVIAYLERQPNVNTVEIVRATKQRT